MGRVNRVSLFLPGTRNLMTPLQVERRINVVLFNIKMFSNAAVKDRSINKTNICLYLTLKKRQRFLSVQQM